MSSSASSFHEHSDEYVKRHGIDVLLEELLQEIVINRPEHPVDFLISELERRRSGAPAPPPAPPAHASAEAPRSSELLLLHFNDVYNVDARSTEPAGGAARFVSAIKSFEEQMPLVLFSGDAFSPSLLSVITRGKQMVPVLNACGVTAACVGNHDLDFGVDVLRSLIADTTFPWLMANVLDPSTGEPLVGDRTLMVTWQGVRVGIMGLVEQEWLTTLGVVDPSSLHYIDFVQEGRRLLAELREAGCELVIALTHMRLPNDIRLAREVPGIDLVLGGHDHDYELERVGSTLVVKSGTDFRELTALRVRVDRDGGEVHVTVTSAERVEVTSEVPEDEAMREVVEGYESHLADYMDNRIGETDVPLDARFAVVRTRESNVGNFVADVMRSSTGADVALLNGGTLRTDGIIPRGELKMKDLVGLLPMMDALVVLEVTGAQLLAALENGVSQYPKLEGRFAQVSGVRFSFDPSLPPGSRIIPGTVFVGEKPLEGSSKYKLCTKEYMARGRDGYAMLESARVLVDAESAPVLPTIVRNYFTMLSVLNGFRTSGTPVDRAVGRLKQLIGLPRSAYRLSPSVDGRIVNVAE